MVRGVGSRLWSYRVSGTFGLAIGGRLAVARFEEKQRRGRIRSLISVKVLINCQTLLHKSFTFTCMVQLCSNFVVQKKLNNTLAEITELAVHLASQSAAVFPALDAKSSLRGFRV